MKYDIFFDFDMGDISCTRDGNLCLAAGKTALGHRIRKVLHTARGRYRVYFNNPYGGEFESLLIGKSLPSAYVEAEVERIVKDCIENMEDVTSVGSFSVRRDGSCIEVEFTVSSIYGDINVKEVL